jgi:trehalose 6-phosphate phosphatase
VTLPRPATAAGQAGLAALLAEPARALVTVDFDGTLSPIVERPDEARPVTGGLAALRAAARAFGQVAILTGRPAGWVVEVPGLAEVAGLVIVGQYGAERWAAGELHVSEPHGGLAAVRQDLPRLVAGRPARIEDKGVSLVVHTRGAEHPDAELAALSGPVRALAEKHGLTAHLGRYVLEVRPPGFDKGRALRVLVRDCDAGAVLFAGDDLGDLPAFAEVAALRERGIPGLTVCSASAEVRDLAEEADIVVDGPAGVAALLTSLAAAATARSG